MPVRHTTVFSKNLAAFNSGIRRIVNKGGTSSSKTVSLLQLFYAIANDRKKEGVLISVISETFPHLRLGAIRDFEIILREHNLIKDRHYSVANHVYEFDNSIIEFFSADSGKATGPRRDIAYFNECINIPYAVVSEVEQRTRECLFYDYNPHHSFWVDDKVLSLPSNEFVLIKSNVYDNQYCPDSIRKEIELKASMDENYKRIHIDIEYGVYEGLIFQNWTMVDEMPETSKQVHGMDFGFTNDPTTFVDVRMHDGGLWFDELLYQTGMTNGDIIQFLKTTGIGRKPIIADSAEPKSIREIQLSGFNILGADKGNDSIRAGIDRIKSYPMFVTKRSVNRIRELRNYKWKMDKNGNSLNVPVDIFNHLIDPMRYGAMVLTGAKKAGPTSWLG